MKKNNPQTELVRMSEVKIVYLQAVMLDSLFLKYTTDQIIAVINLLYSSTEKTSTQFLVLLI